MGGRRQRAGRIWPNGNLRQIRSWEVDPLRAVLRGVQGPLATWVAGTPLNALLPLFHGVPRGILMFTLA